MSNLVDELIEKIGEVLNAPFVDPEAPEGLVRPEFIREELRRRVELCDALFDEAFDKVAGDDEVLRMRLEKQRRQIRSESSIGSLW